MSKVPVDSSRPRTTKNVYFFKSGDHSFDGVRIPVNLRRYRTLDALLDDLSGKIPGLPRGVRQLRTPHGREQVKELEQLQHLGGYICTEKLYVGGRIPGIDFNKIKSPNNFLSHETFSNSALPPKPKPAMNSSPKKKKKKKKKKSRMVVEGDAQLLNSNLEEEALEDFVIRANADESDHERQVESDHEEDDEEESRERNSNEYGRSQENLEDIEERDEEQEEEFQRRIRRSSGDDEDQDEAEGDFMESQDVVGKPSFSAPGTPAERRKFDDNPLSPLDSKKLKHVQRRRMASKQINAEEYTLPSERTSISSTKTKKSTKSKKSVPNMQPRPSFDDRMRIEEYGTPQQEKIFEAEGKRELNAPASPARTEKNQTNTPLSMRSVTPLESRNEYENPQQIERSNVPQTPQSTRQRTARSTRTNATMNTMNQLTTALVHRETAANLQEAYTGRGENDKDSMMGSPRQSKPATPFEINENSENEKEPDGEDIQANMDKQRDDPENEVNEWHDFMSSINDENGAIKDNVSEHRQTPNDRKPNENLSDGEIYSDEVDEWNYQNESNSNNQQARRDADEEVFHENEGHDQDHEESNEYNSGEEPEENRNGSRNQQVPSKENFDDDALNEEWVDEWGTKRQSEFMVVSHNENNEAGKQSRRNSKRVADEPRRNQDEVGHLEKQMQKSSMMDSGVSSVDGDAIAAN